jgi:hypothetical protein
VSAFTNDYLRPQDQQVLNTARDDILDLISRHEKEQHGGGCCIEDRIAAVAFIAHSLGLAADDDDAWEFARNIVRNIYEATHDLH